MFKFFSFFSLALVLFSCQKKLPFSNEQKQSQKYSQKDPAFEIEGKKIKDLMVLLFRKDLTQDSWNQLMSSVKQMNQNKDRIQILRALEKTPQSELEIDSLVQENIEILIDLYENKTAYLLSWTDVENCTWQSDNKTDRFNLQCKPLYDVYGENPMNGGLPKLLEPSRFVSKPINGTLELTQWLSFDLSLLNPNASTASYLLKAYLRPDGKDQYSGEIILDQPLYLERDIEGTKTLIEAYPYGIIQMRL